LSASGGTGTLTYLWSNSATSKDLSGLAAGTYTVTITDANSCTKSASATLIQPTALTPSATPSGSAPCASGTVSIVVSATGGTSPYIGTGTFTHGAGSYSYTVTDTNGCSATASGTVSVANNSTAIVVTATPGTISCNGGSTSVVVAASGGTGTYSSGVGTENNVTAGTHTYVVTDNAGCSGSVTIAVTEPAPIAVTGTLSSGSCSLNSATVQVAISGGTAPYSSNYTFNNAGTSCTYNVTDSRGCTGSAVINQ